MPVLEQDAFGNYVVQYILELGHAEASGAVIRTLLGNIAELSMQKFSSNVVEKCLKLSGVVSCGVV
jgi:pumilio RNA-binding family